MPTLSTDWSWHHMVSSRVQLLFFMLIGAIIAWNLYAYLGVNWELLATKHYFAEHYYGGYADSVLTRNGALFTVQFESWPCLGYVRSSLMPNGDAYSFSLQADRLYTCGFLPSLVVRLLGGHIQLESAIVAINFLLWVASIMLTYAVVGAWSKNRTAALTGATIAAGYPIYGLM